jgi:hypothetical protein
MRSWMAFSWLLLLLGGCATEMVPEGELPEESTGQTGSQLVLDEIPHPSVPQQTAPSTIDPSAPIANASGGKPQPDPWRDRAHSTRGPNKPQPDPWAPVNSTQTHYQSK